MQRSADREDYVALTLGIIIILYTRKLQGLLAARNVGTMAKNSFAIPDEQSVY